MTGDRFRDRRERKYAYDFIDEVRLCCGECGYVDDEPDGSVVVGGPVDPFFRRPVWLQASCRGHVLWAYNVRHLDLLESYVAAKLRERGDVVAGAPASLVERLPTWLKTAKNRAEVLHTIARLRATLRPGLECRLPRLPS